LTINSSILILAGASYYYNPNSPGEADLEGAHALLRNNIGNGAAIIFALALLCVSA
jgi:metal iron transporter